MLLNSSTSACQPTSTSTPTVVTISAQICEAYSNRLTTSPSTNSPNDAIAAESGVWNAAITADGGRLRLLRILVARVHSRRECSIRHPQVGTPLAAAVELARAEIGFTGLIYRMSASGRKRTFPSLPGTRS